MASIEEVKAVLAQAAEQGDATLNQIRSPVKQTEQVFTRLRVVAAGTSHAKVSEAIQRANENKQNLQETANLIQGEAATAARQHCSVMG